MVLLTTAGLQVPVIVILLDELTGNVTTLAPSQMVVLLPKEKVGSIFGFTVTVSVVPATHPADVGVNTYVSDRVVSIVAGVHVPVMPLVEVSGNLGTLPLWQIVRDVPNGKEATTFGITTVVSLYGTPQVLGSGVKV